jgi:phage-related protein
MARVENSPQIAMRLRTLAPFDIGFDCKPQRFLKDGENAVVFTESGSIFNQYGQVSLPFITLYGNGAGWLTIGKITISVTSLDGTLYLDSETQNAYNNNGNQNMNIIAPVFPVLPDGESIVAWGGNIERVEIVPRWWEL